MAGIQQIEEDIIATFMVDVILQTVVNATINSLSYSELFENLEFSKDYDNITDYVVKSLIRGQFTGYLYKRGEEAIFLSSNENEVEFKTLEKIDLRSENIFIKNTLYQLLYALYLQYAGLFNTRSEAIAASKAIIFKVNNLRATLTQDHRDGLIKKISSVFSSVKKGEKEILTTDAMDSIERYPNGFGTGELEKKDIMGETALFTGFTFSFFSGIFSNNISGNNVSDDKKNAEACESFFRNYLAKFFRLISKDIKSTKSKMLVLRENLDILNALEQNEFLSEFIDIEQMISEMGLPMKKTNSNG